MFPVGEATESHVGATQQHQCLIVHKALSCASLTVQVAIHKLPVCDPLQFVLSWTMEKEGLKTRVRMGCQLESKIPFLSGTVRVDFCIVCRSHRLFRRSRSECANYGSRRFKIRSRMKSSYQNPPCRRLLKEDNLACGWWYSSSSLCFSFCSTRLFVNKELYHIVVL